VFANISGSRFNMDNAKCWRAGKPIALSFVDIRPCEKRVSEGEGFREKSRNCADLTVDRRLIRS